MLARDEIGPLLERTSRTFALAIPLLEGELADEVGLAYLLFRIADTLEDADRWDRGRRHRALLSFANWVLGDDDRAFLALAKESAPSTNADVAKLVLRADDVLAALAHPEIVRPHLARTAKGMANFVSQQDESGGLSLPDLDALERYCYVVAGIVGEMLTALFAREDPALRERLMPLAKAFGEGLQLVNILKDAPDDAKEGRVYLPASSSRASIRGRARRDLEHAARYVEMLEIAKAPRGTIAFCTLPIRLAWATLNCLEQGGKKLPRDETLAIVADVARTAR